MADIKLLSPQNSANLFFALGHVSAQVPYQSAALLARHIEAQGARMNAQQLSCVAQGLVHVHGFKVWQQKELLRTVIARMLPIVKTGEATAQEVCACLLARFLCLLLCV